MPECLVLKEAEVFKALSFLEFKKIKLSNAQDLEKVQYLQQTCAKAVSSAFLGVPDATISSVPVAHNG